VFFKSAVIAVAAGVSPSKLSYPKLIAVSVMRGTFEL